MVKEGWTQQWKTREIGLPRLCASSRTGLDLRWLSEAEVKLRQPHCSIPVGAVGTGALFWDTPRMLPDGPGRSQSAPGSTRAVHSELSSAEEACRYASCRQTCC